MTLNECQGSSYGITGICISLRLFDANLGFIFSPFPYYPPAPEGERNLHSSKTSICREKSLRHSRALYLLSLDFLKWLGFRFRFGSCTSFRASRSVSSICRQVYIVLGNSSFIMCRTEQTAAAYQASVPRGAVRVPS